AVVEQRAGVAVAAVDLDRRAAELDHAKAGREVVEADPRDVAVAEPAVVATTPALDPAGVEHGAGVLPAGAERDDRRADRDRASPGRGVVEALRGVDVAVAELAAARRAPAADRAVVEQRAGVGRARDDLRDRAADLDRAVFGDELR